MQAASYRWVIFWVMMGVYMIGLFQRLSLGVVRQPLAAEFEMDAGLFGYLGGIYFNAYMLMQIPTGLLTDSWGAKKTMETGSLLMVLGTFLFAMAPDLSLLFAGRLLCGLGAAMLYIPIMKVVSFWFTEKEYGSMTGLINFVGYVGGMLAQAPLAYLTADFSWRHIFLGIGAAAGLLLLLSRRWLYSRPEEAGLIPLPETDCRFVSQPMNWHQLRGALKHLLSQPKSWPPAMMAFGVFGAYNALSGVWGASYISEVYGQTVLQASSTLVFALIGMCMGCLVLTRLSEQQGRRKPLSIGCCTLLCFCWALLMLNSRGFLPFWALRLLLFTLGLSSSVVVLAVVSIKEMHPATFSGMSVSIYNLACFLGATVAAPAIGQIISYSSGSDGAASLPSPSYIYGLAFGVCLGLVGLAWLGSLLVKETYCRNIEQ